MFSMHCALVRQLLLPAFRRSSSWLPSDVALASGESRRMRLLHARSLRAFAPPVTPSQARCWQWVIADGEGLMTGLLYAGVVLHRRNLRKQLVHGFLRERLVAALGVHRLTAALRHDGDSLDIRIDEVSEQQLKAFGLAVMYRQVRSVSVEAGRRLLRRMASDDPCLRAALGWVRRLPASACLHVGALVLESFNVLEDERE